MFGNILKELRMEKKLTQDKLAKVLHTTQQTLARWEKDDTNPSPEMLKKLSEYFNVSIDYLYGNAKTRTTIDQQISPDIKHLLNNKYMTYNGEEISEHDRNVLLNIIEAYLSSK